MYDHTPPECAAIKPSKVSPIEEAQDRVSHGIEHLNELLSRLEGRLDPILQPESPERPGANEVHPVASRLHGQIMSSARDLVAVHARVESLLGRLTV